MMFPQLHTFGVHTGICKYIIAYMLLHINLLQVNTKSTASNTSNTLSTDTLQTLQGEGDEGCVHLDVRASGWIL